MSILSFLEISKNSKFEDHVPTEKLAQLKMRLSPLESRYIIPIEKYDFRL